LANCINQNNPQRRTMQINPRRLAFSPCGHSLWGVTTEGDALRFDTSTGAIAQRLRAPHRGGCDALVFAAGGRILVTGGRDGLLKAWRLSEGAFSTEGAVGVHQQPSPLLRLAAAGGGAGGATQARRWDGPVSERPPPHETFVGHPGAVAGVPGSKGFSGGGGVAAAMRMCAGCLKGAGS
jgi:hypothetical protein